MSVHPTYSIKEFKRKGIGLYVTTTSTLRGGNELQKYQIPINFNIDKGKTIISFEYVTSTTIGEDGKCKYVNFVYASRKTGEVVVAHYNG